MLPQNFLVLVTAALTFGVSAAPVYDGTGLESRALLAKPKVATAPLAKTPLKPAPVRQPVAPVVPKTAPGPARLPAKKPATQVPAKKPTTQVPAKKPTKPVGPSKCKRGPDDECDSGPAKTGDTFKVGTTTVKLGARIAGGSVVFEATANGESAIAKTGVDANEISNTEKASAALGSGLFIATGPAKGQTWLILKKLSGKDFGSLGRAAGGFSKAVCQAHIQKAVQLAAAAQGRLSKTGFIQGDENQENYLFNSAFTSVDIIDFGTIRKAFGTEAQIEAGQARALAADTFTLENMIEIGACKST